MPHQNHEAFARVLNLKGQMKTDSTRVHKSRYEGTNHGLRDRMQDLTPELLAKHTGTSVHAFSDPETKLPKQKERWLALQGQETKLSRERFINSIGTKIFLKGRGKQRDRDIQAENQWNLIEAIRQGRVDMMDVGRSAGQPGYTYNSENIRDPGLGMPPDLALALRVAQDHVSTMTPGVRKSKRPADHMQSIPYQSAYHNSGVGDMKDGDIEDKGLGYRTSDYQAEHYYPPNIPTQYTQTSVANVNAARANYSSNVEALDGSAAEHYSNYESKRLKTRR